MLEIRAALGRPSQLHKKSPFTTPRDTCTTSEIFLPLSTVLYLKKHVRLFLGVCSELRALHDKDDGEPKQTFLHTNTKPETEA